MPAEAPRIIVTGKQALRYVDAIEGLIFDPYPYRSPDTNGVKPIEKPRGGLRLPWFRFLQEEPTPTRDPIESRLESLWASQTSKRMYALTEGRPKSEPIGENREYLFETGLYKINERPSLLVGAGESRTYQVDVQLLSDPLTRVIFSYLHLFHPVKTFYDAHILMSGMGVMRVEAGGGLTGNYTPSYVEQQRLLVVAELFEKHKVIPRV